MTSQSQAAAKPTVAIDRKCPTIVIQVERRALPRAALLSFERVVRVAVCEVAPESRRAKVIDSSEEFDKALWHGVVDRIRVRLQLHTNSRLGQQPGAADLGGTLVKGPQRLLASLRGQCNVEAVREVCRSFAELLNRDFERALGFEGQLGCR
jgi:hypothetical protein